VGGGGTSHVCVFDWLGESQVSPACVICLTDLDTEFPVFDSSIPVLWAVSGKSDAVAPFGQVVSLSC
jgi:predicted metal-dependent peptidase